MSILKWTGVGVEYAGKAMQAADLEDLLLDAVKGALDAGVEALKADNPKAAAKAAASREAELAAAAQEVRSAPFHAALERAVVDAPGVVGDMLDRVSVFDRSLLVPCAAPERLLASYFEARIGGAAEARRGLSGALARRVTDDIVASVAALPRRNGWFAKPHASLIVGRAAVTAHHLFRVEPEFAWGPRRRRGYLMGHAISSFGRSGRGVDQPAPAVPPGWTEKARVLEQRLGALSRERRGVFFDGWTSFAWRDGVVQGPPGGRSFLLDLT